MDTEKPIKIYQFENGRTIHEYIKNIFKEGELQERVI